jgi:hypothetical protein
MNTYRMLAGAADKSVVIRIVDETTGAPETGVVFNTSGIDLQYRREGAASVAITEATLSALTDAHTDGGFLHIGNGYYRLDLPDAAIASGVTGVLVHGTVTGMVVMGCYIHLDPIPADVRQFGGSNGTFSSGRPEVNTTHAAGTAWGSGAITAAALAADAGAEIADAVWDELLAGHVTAGSAGARLYSPYTAQLTAGSATGGTFPSGGGVSTIDNFYNNAIAVVIAGTGAGQFRVIDDYVGSTRVWSVATGDDFITALDNTSVVMIVPGVSSVGSGSGPTAAAIADAVWDEATSGHTTSGTFGERATRIPNAAAGASGGLPTVDGSNRIAGIQGTITTLDALDTAQDTQHSTTQGRLPAALVSGRMDSSVGAYQSGQAPLQPTVAGRTLDVSAGGEAGLDWANIGSPTTTVNLSGTTIGTVTANSDKTGYRLSATGVDDVHDEVVEGSLTLRGIVRILLAEAAGECAPGSTTIFYAQDGTTPRITATTPDVFGERTAVTLNAA